MGEEIDLTEPKDKETTICDENREKYHQTEATCPFQQYPMRVHFGGYGEGIATRQALQGTYRAPYNVSNETKQFIQHCEFIPIQIPPTTLKHSLQYYKQSWAKMKEKTGCSGRHFGHYKAGMRNDFTSYLHYVMAEIPFWTGYSPTRWRQATNLMILKTPNLNRNS